MCVYYSTVWFSFHCVLSPFLFNYTFNSLGVEDTNICSFEFFPQYKTAAQQSISLS